MILLLIITTLLIFQGMIENFIPLFSYFDEFLLLALIIGAFISCFIIKQKIRLYNLEIFSIVVLIIAFMTALYSNMKFGIVKSPKAYLVSGILGIKPFIIYYLARIIYRDLKVNKTLLLKYSILLENIINIYIIVVIVNIPFNFLKSFSRRFLFFPSVAAGFQHPAQLDFMAISIMIIQLFIYRILHKDLKKYNLILIKCFILIICSGRTKAIVFYFLFIIIFYLSKVFKKFKLIYSAFFSPLLLYLASDRINSEILREGSARGALYNASFKIAYDYFPLGSGFGTFGTEYSRKYYSPLYYIYHLNTVYGLSPIYPAYITDTHWAAIIGEFGILGTIFYFLAILKLTIFIVCFYNKDRLIKLSIYGLWGYGLIASLSDSILTSYRGVSIMISTVFMISIMLNLEKNNYN